jgi:hypothetical protein
MGPPINPVRFSELEIGGFDVSMHNRRIVSMEVRENDEDIDTPRNDICLLTSAIPPPAQFLQVLTVDVLHDQEGGLVFGEVVDDGGERRVP